MGNEEKKAELERKRKEEEEKKKEVENKKKEAEMKKKEAENTEKEAENTKKEAENRKKEAELKKKEQEEKRKEDQRKKKETEKLRKEAEKKRKQEEKAAEKERKKREKSADRNSLKKSSLSLNIEKASIFQKKDEKDKPKSYKAGEVEAVRNNYATTQQGVQLEENKRAAPQSFRATDLASFRTNFAEKQGVKTNEIQPDPKPVQVLQPAGKSSAETLKTKPPIAGKTKKQTTPIPAPPQEDDKVEHIEFRDEDDIVERIDFTEVKPEPAMNGGITKQISEEIYEKIGEDEEEIVVTGKLEIMQQDQHEVVLISTPADDHEEKNSQPEHKTPDESECRIIPIQIEGDLKEDSTENTREELKTDNDLLTNQKSENDDNENIEIIEFEPVKAPEDRLENDKIELEPKNKEESDIEVIIIKEVENDADQNETKPLSENSSSHEVLSDTNDNHEQPLPVKEDDIIGYDVRPEAEVKA